MYPYGNKIIIIIIIIYPDIYFKVKSTALDTSGFGGDAQ